MIQQYTEGKEVIFKDKVQNVRRKSVSGTSNTLYAFFSKAASSGDERMQSLGFQ